MMWLINSLGPEVTDFMAFNGDICDPDDLAILYNKISEINDKAEDVIDFMFNLERLVMECN